MKTIADSPDSRKRETGWDVLRVLACLMVIVIHARNPYTYGADGALDPSLTARTGRWIRGRPFSSWRPGRVCRSS